MVTRNDILSKAVDDCMRDLYTKVQPAVEWDDFVTQCKEYNKKYGEWEMMRENRPPIEEYCGPRPYEFYYLPRDIMKEITDSYVGAYKIDSQQELLDTIETLKNYCKEPIVDKYIEDYTDEYGNHHPGHRGYDHPANLHGNIVGILKEAKIKGDQAQLANTIVDKFFSFLDMAGDFYNWSRDFNSFNMSIYLGASPCSNKDNVIKNWKKYRNVDITIDENMYKEEDEDIYYKEETDGAE